MSEQRNDDVRNELSRQSPDLALLLDAIRDEFDAKLSSLRAWGFAMCVGGGFVGGLVGELIRPGSAGDVVARVFG